MSFSNVLFFYCIILISIGGEFPLMDTSDVVGFFVAAAGNSNNEYYTSTSDCNDSNSIDCISDSNKNAIVDSSSFVSKNEEIEDYIGSSATPKSNTNTTNNNDNDYYTNNAVANDTALITNTTNSTNGDSSNGGINNFCNNKMMTMTMFMHGFQWSFVGNIKNHNHDNSDNFIFNKTISKYNSTAYSDLEKISGSTSSNTIDTSTPSSSQQQQEDEIPDCLSYYVSTWKLVNSGKFIGAMIYSFLLAILSEGISSLRASAIIPLLHKRGIVRRLVLTMFYMFQEWLGICVMLIAMMYSIELLFSVILGLSVGHFIFFKDPNRYRNNNLAVVQHTQT